MVQQAAAIKKALDSALTDPHAWNGKRCNMHLDFTVERATAEPGDKKAETKRIARL